jgi:hypothetical protein
MVVGFAVLFFPMYLKLETMTKQLSFMRSGLAVLGFICLTCKMQDLINIKMFTRLHGNECHEYHYETAMNLAVSPMTI